MRKRDFHIVQSLIIMITSLSALALFGAIFGIFYGEYIFILWVIICAFLYHKEIITFPRPTRNFVTYSLIITSFALFIAFFTTPTIFSGRDQGSISTAAMQLTHSHSLISYGPEIQTFFEIYGPGKALNFPGFHYLADGGLITQFPLPYISYLGIFFAFFGTGGFIIANTALFIIFGLSIITIARVYIKPPYTYIFLLLLLSSFSIGWFAKFTLSENIANMLLWSSAALYLYLNRHPNSTTFTILIISLSLLLFSRIEGIWFFIIFLFLIGRNPAIRTFIKKDIWWRAIFPLVTVFSFSCSVLVMNAPFIKTMGQAFLKTSSSTASTSSIFEEIIALSSTYSLYGLTAPLIISALFCVIALKKPEFRTALFPLAITFPLFVYYLFPHISGDHPWMLRRFVFALLPATILISAVFISHLPRKNRRQEFSTALLITTMLILQFPAFFSFATYAENSQLQEQVEEFSKQFSNKDLLLIDMETAHSGWSMITGPLQQLNDVSAVYFFNSEDFTKANFDQFEDVYLIAPRHNISRYSGIIASDFSYYNKFSFTTNQIQPQKITNPQLQFPIKKTTTTHGVIFKMN